MHVKDKDGKQIYLMVDKSKIGLLDTTDISLDDEARVVYEGGKSVATFQKLSNGDLVVTENYNHTCLLRQTTSGIYN